MRRTSAWLVVTALLVAGCSSSDGSSSSTTVAEGETAIPSEPTVPVGEDEEPAEPPALRSGVAFTSADGTALPGSFTSFVVEDAAAGSSTIVVVPGAEEATRHEVDLAPGSYTITPITPAITANGTSIVDLDEPIAIVVPDPTAEAPVQIVDVDFSLTTLTSPLQMSIERMTATTIDLAWQEWATGAVDLDAPVTYQVRRTNGAVAAGSLEEGTPVPLLTPSASRVSVVGLDPATEYTFTVFAEFVIGGERDVWTSSLTATTAAFGPEIVAFALAPNTIVPTDFAALGAERISENEVRISLSPGGWGRSSSSDAPLLEEGALDVECIVGSPFLAPTDIAGDEAFYGIIQSCEQAAVAGLRRTAAAATAIVNTAVPLSAVFSYLDLEGEIPTACYDLGSPDPQPIANCESGPDSDGDGLGDAAEVRAGTDAASADTDGDAVDDFTEVAILGTDPLNPDSDFDSLPDDEGGQFGTDPLNPDSDLDGCWDRGEIEAGRNPVDPADATDGAPCPTPAGAVRWEDAVDRDREEHRVGLPDGEVAPLALPVPAGLPGGDVQVTLLWSSGDDLDLMVTEPSGAVLAGAGEPTLAGGALQPTDAGGECGDSTPRAEHAAWDEGPSGLYFVDVARVAPCDGPAVAQVQVRVGGDLVVDATVVVGLDGPIAFNVGAAPLLTDLAPPADLATGKVQVSLLWSSGDDLDLFVTAPNGETISYLQPSGASDGFLDADDLGGDCSGTTPRVENIVWSDAAPDGEYTVEVVDSRSCDVASQARLVVSVDGQVVIDQGVTVGTDGPLTFRVGSEPALEPPPDLGTGEIQVTLAWTSGDDVDLFVTEPTGDRVWYDAPTSAAGGFLDADDRGDCQQADVVRFENVYWETAPPEGTYTIEVVTSGACAEGPVIAQLVALVQGEPVVAEEIEVGAGRTFTFSYPLVAAEPAAFSSASELLGIRRASTSAALQGVSAAPSFANTGGSSAARAPLLAVPRLECEVEGEAAFGLNQKISPKASVDLTLTTSYVGVTVNAGIELSINPEISISAKAECSIEDLPELEIPALKTSPVPVVVSLGPAISASAEAKVTVTGPGVTLYGGVETSAGISVAQRQCEEQQARQVEKSEQVERKSWSIWGLLSSWWETVKRTVTEVYYALVPCGIELRPTVNAKPVTTFTQQPFTASLEGTLGFDLGVTAKLAFGKELIVAGSTAGVEGTLSPLSAELEAKLGTGGSCLELSLGLAIDLVLKLEAFVSVVKRFAAEKEIPLYEDRFTYPGAVLEFGDDCDD